MNRTLPTHWFLFGLACAAVLPAVYTLDPRLDVDTWWHMAVGRWIVQHRDVPWIDPFSQMSHDTPTRWYAYSWYYDLWMYQLQDKYGYSGIVLVGRMGLCLLSTSVVFAYVVHRGGMTVESLCQSALMGIVLSMFPRERPWHITIALTTLTFWVVQYLREGGSPRRVWWMPLIYIFWANVHIQFVYGWAILGIACLFPASASRSRLITITLVCLAASCLNPYHIRLFIVIVEYASHSAPGEYINELAPPEWSAPSTIATGLLIVIGFLTVIRKRSFDWFSFTILIVASLLAMRMRREIWFAAVAAIASISSSQRSDIDIIKSLRYFIATSVPYVTAFGVLLFRCQMYNIIDEVNALRWPIDGSYFYLKAEYRNPDPKLYEIAHPKYRILNHFDHGSWLIWDGLAVSIDGRTNLYGDERIRDSFRLWNCEGDWQQHPDLIGASEIYALKDAPLTNWLLQSKHWHMEGERHGALRFERIRKYRLKSKPDPDVKP